MVLQAIWLATLPRESGDLAFQREDIDFVLQFGIRIWWISECSEHRRGLLIFSNLHVPLKKRFCAVRGGIRNLSLGLMASQSKAIKTIMHCRSFATETLRYWRSADGTPEGSAVARNSAHKCFSCENRGRILYVSTFGNSPGASPFSFMNFEFRGCIYIICYIGSVSGNNLWDVPR